MIRTINEHHRAAKRLLALAEQCRAHRRPSVERSRKQASSSSKPREVDRGYDCGALNSRAAEVGGTLAS